MPPTYRVKNWDELYETHETRKLKTLKWVNIPTKHGRGYNRIMRHQKSAEIFTAWILILQVASNGNPRGTLADNDGPFSAIDMADKTLFPVSAFVLAFEYLSSNEIGWLEKVENNNNLTTSGDSPAIAGNIGTRREKSGIELNRIELNRKEVKDKTKEPKSPADTARQVFNKSFSKTQKPKTDQYPQSPLPHKTAFTINGHPIAYSYWQKIINKMGGDRHQAARVFYRAAMQAREGIEKWIEAGLIKKQDGKIPYALLPIDEESRSPPAVDTWIEENIWGPMKYKIQPELIGNILRQCGK